MLAPTLVTSPTKILDDADIKKSLGLFIDGQGKNKGRDPNERYASFDFCYTYFYSFYKRNRLHELASKEYLQMSCLQLGFYLASWGMLRGSSFLLEKSVRSYANLIQTIANMDPELWRIDVDSYTDEHISQLLDCRQQITVALGRTQATDTLTTKIMLGVFGNVPAFDQYFRKGFKVHTFNRDSLLKVKEFYDKHKSLFDSIKIQAFDFSSGGVTDIIYPKAKLIDMYGFMAGQ